MALDKNASRKSKKNNYFLLAVGIPLIIFLILGSQFMWKENFTTVQVEQTDISDKFEGLDKYNLTLSIRTDNSRYIPGQINVFQGLVYNDQGLPVNASIDFILEKNQTKLDSASTFAKDGKFRVTDISIEKTGEYTVYAKAIKDKNVGYAQTSFHVVEFYQTKLGTGIIATVIFTISLLILIGIQTKIELRITSVEPLRFALLTLCSLIPIISLLAADAQIGQDSPLGLIIREVPLTLNNLDLNNPRISETTIGEILEQKTSQRFEWAIHVGGSPHDNYTSGIIIPVYVFIFGMLGGYIKFLHKTASGWFVTRAEIEWKRLNPMKENKLKEELINLATKADNEGYLRILPKGEKEEESKIQEDKAIIKRIIFNNSMEDLALIFLSPILAFVTFFILSQGGVDPNTNMPTIAIASFATGLITKEIINRLENTVSASLNPKNTKRENLSPESQNGETENN